MAGLAAANACANGFTGIEVIADRIETAVFPRPFDHAIANPPYHPPNGTASPVAARETAKRGSDALMVTWIGRLSGALRHRGSLTLIVPAGMVPPCLAAMVQYRCPCTDIFPLWPKTGLPAKLVLLRGVKNAQTPVRLAPGLVLHNPDGSFTAAAQAILADGAALSLGRQAGIRYRTTNRWAAAASSDGHQKFSLRASKPRVPLVRRCRARPRGQMSHGGRGRSPAMTRRRRNAIQYTPIMATPARLSAVMRLIYISLELG